MISFLCVQGLIPNGKPIPSLYQAVNISNKVYRRIGINIHSEILSLEEVLREYEAELRSLIKYPDNSDIVQELLTQRTYGEFLASLNVRQEKGIWMAGNLRLKDMHLSEMPIELDEKEYWFLPRTIRKEELGNRLINVFLKSNRCINAEQLVVEDKTPETYRANLINAIKKMGISQPHVKNLSVEELELITLSLFSYQFFHPQEAIFFNNKFSLPSLFERDWPITPIILHSMIYCNSITYQEERKEIFFRIIDAIENRFKIIPGFLKSGDQLAGEMLRVSLREDYGPFAYYHLKKGENEEKIRKFLNGKLGAGVRYLFDTFSYSGGLLPNNEAVVRSGAKQIYCFMRSAISSGSDICIYPAIRDSAIAILALILHEVGHAYDWTNDDICGICKSADEDRLMMMPVDLHKGGLGRRLTTASLKIVYPVHSFNLS